MKRQLLVFVLLLTIIACGWNHPCTKTRSYNLGEEKIATVGSEMVQNGCYAARWEPQGAIVRFLRSPYDDSYFEPWIDKELLYSGREGNVLHITYREYSVRGLARTPFFQHVYYDLKNSHEIVFQDWLLQVLDANNQQIKFKVVNEPRQLENAGK
jgi:hypothetical protein